MNHPRSSSLLDCLKTCTVKKIDEQEFSNVMTLFLGMQRIIPETTNEELQYIRVPVYVPDSVASIISSSMLILSASSKAKLNNKIYEIHSTSRKLR